MFGEGERYSQMIEEFAARDVFGAEGENVGGRLLTVHEVKSPGLKLAYKRNQRDFRCIGYTGEHRFCEESSTDRYPVEPAY